MIDLAPVRRQLKRLERAEGKIARRNARRAAFGALRSIRLQIERDYPSVVVSAPRMDRTERAARSWHWRKVEYTLVKPGRRRWDRDLASRFNEWFCQQEGFTVKPIRFDVPDGSRFVGRHDLDAIRLKGIDTRAKWRDAEFWRTFLHEVAHYKVHGHGAAFRSELLKVYRLWLEFCRSGAAS